MPWKSTAISVGGSLLGGLMGGGSKAPIRAAKDAAALQNFMLMKEQAQQRLDTKLYRESGERAQTSLNDLLGISPLEGYAPRPTYDDSYAETITPYMRKGGKNFRQSNLQTLLNIAKADYDKKLSAWESGLKQYKQQNPNASTGSGSLLKAFSNDDFEKDPGYLARLLEGEQGEQRNLVARGMSDSGQALKQMERYRQDYASNEFGNAYNRDAANKSRTYSFLSGQASQGLGAAQGSSSLSAALAGQAGQAGVNSANNLLNNQNMRDENRSNAIQSAFGNLIYGMNRGGGTPPYVPSTGGYSSPRPGSFASQFVG